MPFPPPPMIEVPFMPHTLGTEEGDMGRLAPLLTETWERTGRRFWDCIRKKVKWEYRFLRRNRR